MTKLCSHIAMWPQIRSVMINKIKNIICKIFGIKQCSCKKTKVFLKEGI
jgi:hypothetical protein